MDVDGGGDDDLIDMAPVWLPCVVVARCRRRPSGPAPPGADVALCPQGGNGPQPGWVETEDPERELVRLAAEVRRSPQASVLLAQVLRTGAGLDVATGLMVESLAYSTLQGGPVFRSWLARRQRSPAKPRRQPADAVVVERRGDVLVLTLNRPQVRNAVDTHLRDGLADGLALACADTSIAAVELRGAGPDFSSGGDLDEFGTLPDPVTAHLVRTDRSAAKLLWRVGEMTTGYVHGACVGAGIELAAFARRVVAAPGSRFQLPEVSMGLVPGSGGTVSIPRRIGRQRTAWLAMTGAELDVAVASSWGLVDDIA